MFGSTNRGANAYAKVGVETGVFAASPHKLISMLFEGALMAIAMGKKYMAEGNIKRKGESITKAILIIDNGLRASLNKNVGGDMVLNLDALYEYMSRRLFEANVNNNPEILTEIHGLLDGIRDAWQQIEPKAGVGVQAAQPAYAAQQSFAKA